LKKRTGLEEPNVRKECLPAFTRNSYMRKQKNWGEKSLKREKEVAVAEDGGKSMTRKVVVSKKNQG